MKPGLGAVVTELRPEEVEELYGLRLRLEPPLAGDIIEHVGRRDIDDIDAAGADDDRAGARAARGVVQRELPVPPPPPV